MSASKKPRKHNVLKRKVNRHRSRLLASQRSEKETIAHYRARIARVHLEPVDVLRNEGEALAQWQLFKKNNLKKLKRWQKIRRTLSGPLVRHKRRATPKQPKKK